MLQDDLDSLQQDNEQVVARQRAISHSKTSHFPFNRAGGRTLTFVSKFPTMKMPTIISTTALIFSLGAGYLALRASSEFSEEEISALVDDRLAARELKFVQAYSPKFREMFAGMDDSEYGADWNPKTMEELVAPLVKITSGMDPEPE